uniref:Reverse transcriptase domain-containing protein n=1 Tax=Trichogramma kaykai TaxID=54128 RepID=A0ABD2W5E6_9HYME
MASSRLESTVKRLEAKKIFELYNEVFQGWLNDKIIEIVPREELGNDCHYLPHRPVLKEGSKTKIRPVFDASACVSGNVSLNNCVEKGPNLVELLPIILNRFRENEIGVISDIKKAFLQIEINKKDRDYLRFLWKLGNKYVHLRHRRVVFGLACSPFLLAAVLELHFNTCLEKAKNETSYVWTRETIKKLKSSFYVDNCVTSVKNEDALLYFRREAKEILRQGGFDLYEWEYSRDSSTRSAALVLGIEWDKQKDTLRLNRRIFSFDVPHSLTKRNILSLANKIFDPIRVTTPVSLLPKRMLQDLWAEKYGWDTELDYVKKTEFTSWVNELHFLKELELTRYIGEGELTIHAFGDASASAYSAAIFARVENEKGVSVQLLNAKSRIAPKTNTIPRLELMAATIEARLANTVVRGLTREVSRIFYWSDSTTVIAWIKREANLNLFVRNRVEEIRKLTHRDNWNHIAGEFNPADLPSRGCSPIKLMQSK